MAKGGGSRQDQILQLLLESEQGMSIDDLAKRLLISRNAVKQHLDILEISQLIQKHALTVTGGRPAQRYTLTEQGINSFPKQYAWFSHLLLSELKLELGEALFTQYMARMGTRLADSLAPQFSTKTDEEKLSGLIATMQGLGYQAQLEEGAAEPAIVALNCVYHTIAQQHPEVCEFDKALLSTLLEKPITQTHCMAKQEGVCRFLLK